MSHEMKPFANTLELIKGQPEYRCILKDQESSFWYSPLAKEKFALLMHDEYGNPWGYGSGPKIGTYSNRLRELLTPEVTLNRQEILDILRELEPNAVKQYEKYRDWHRGRPAKRKTDIHKKPEVQKVAELNNRWENRKLLNCEKQEELKENIKNLTGDTPEGTIKHYCRQSTQLKTVGAAAEYVEAQRLPKQPPLAHETEKKEPER